MKTSRYSQRMHRRLVAAAAETGTFSDTASMVGITRQTLCLWRKQHPQLDADIREAFEEAIDGLADLAKIAIRAKVEEMAEDPSKFDMPTARMVMQRWDKRWGAQYREVEMRQTVAIADALKEFLDEAAQSPR